MNRTSFPLTQRSARAASRAIAGAALIATCAGLWGPAQASTELANIAIPPASVAVHGKLPAPAAGEIDLKFGEMFKMPIGPKGLEPTDKLLSLNGKRVRLIGFMAEQETSAKGVIILTPMPVSLGDEDESLSDDLPGNAAFVHLASPYADKPVPNMRGLLHLSGTLQLGPQDEADGHVSSIRLMLDDKTSRLLTTAEQPKAARHAKSAAKTVASAP